MQVSAKIGQTHSGFNCVYTATPVIKINALQPVQSFNNPILIISDREFQIY